MFTTLTMPKPAALRTTLLPALVAAALLSGCASYRQVPKGAVATPPERKIENLTAPTHAREQFEVYDPLQSANKRLYKFNAQFDDYVFLPVVNTYQRTTPQFVRTGVSNFFSNVGEFRNFTNAALQAAPKKAGITLGRFAVNTTAGVLGFIDVASKIGLKKQPEDFGQTLGKWGVNPGAYVVLPILGPSNVRDTVGLVVDAVTFAAIVPNGVEDSTTYKVVQYGVRPVDARASNPFRYYNTGSPFEYELVRFVNNERRELEVKN